MHDFMMVSTNPVLIDEGYQVFTAKYEKKRTGHPKRYLNWHIKFTGNGNVTSNPGQISKATTMNSSENCNAILTRYSDITSLDGTRENEESPAYLKRPPGERLGQVTYMADPTEPDVGFAAAALAQAIKILTNCHMEQLKRVVQYLHNTKKKKNSCHTAHNKKQRSTFSQTQTIETTCQLENPSRSWSCESTTL